MISVKSKNEIQAMIEAGKIVGELLEVLRKSTFPGITTKELDRIAENYIIKNGAIPSFKGQKGFGRNVPDYPASICASVNDEIIHGIPGGRTLKEGDIVSIDVGAEYKGYHGDAARTFPVGNISKDAQRLIDVTRESFFTGIRKAVPGNRIFEISGAIQDYVESNGYTVVREFVGHGIGRELHEEPEVPNYRGRIKGPRLVAGMAIAVEPMVNEGTASIYLGKNNWTVYTADGKLSAHYENTIIITDGDPLLTTLIS